MSKLVNLAVHWPSKVWPVGKIARKICSTIERIFKIRYTTGHFIPKKYLSLVFYDNRNLKISKKLPRNRNSISVTKSKFLSVFSMNTLLAILKVTDTILHVTLAGGLYHRFPCRHLPPPPPLTGPLLLWILCTSFKDFQRSFYTNGPSTFADCFWWGSSLDCKTVRICAYSSTREQSNKRSVTRLKTESTRPTGVWGSRASRA